MLGKISHFIPAFQVNVHPAQLTLEALSGVSLHYLGADIAGGDVLVGVLCELVGRLKNGWRGNISWGPGASSCW